MWTSISCSHTDGDMYYMDQTIPMSENNHHHHHHHHHSHGNEGHHHDYAHYSHHHDDCFENSTNGQSIMACPPLDTGMNPCDQPISNQYCSYQNCYYAENWNVVPDVNKSPTQPVCCPTDKQRSNVIRCASEHDDCGLDKSKILKEITDECEHFLNKKQCDTCKIRDDSGEEQAIPLSDLVDIVLQTVEGIKQNTVIVNNQDYAQALNKKKSQNKEAAAKYRDKQKAKWTTLLDTKHNLEKRNEELKKKASSLEKEIADFRAKLLKKA